LIDEEIRSVIDRNYERSERILRENMDKMHLMAEALMQYETIDRFQIDEIMEGRVPSPPQSWEETPPSAGATGTGSSSSRPRDVRPIGGTAESL
jgi:cell division protease FtsH